MKHDGSDLVIPTRQKNDDLFSSSVPLGVGGTVTSPARDIKGYQGMLFLASSEVAFTISVREACIAAGPFVQVMLLTSVLTAGRHVVCERVNPCGEFMTSVLSNTSGTPQTTLDFCVNGLPQP